MPINSPIVNSNPNQRDVVILQRSNDNQSYGEIHISGSGLIFYIDSSGYLNADPSGSFYSVFPPPAAGLVVGATYPITASWSVNTVNGGSGTTLFTGSLYFITSSWAENSVSSSNALTASFALNAGGSSGTTLFTGSLYFITASWAIMSSTALSAISASWASQSLSSYFSTTASWATPHSASEIPMLAFPSSKYNNVQQLQDIFHSAGWTGGGNFITSSQSGSFSVAAGDGLIRAVASSTASIYWFSWNSASFDLTPNANTEIFVYADYNSGNPIVITSSIDPTLIDYQTNVLLGNIYYASSSIYNKLHINETTRPTVGDHAKLMIRFNKAIMPYARESGGSIAGQNLTFNITTGAFWEGLNRFITNAFDSTGSGRFDYFYVSGSTWTDVPNNQNIDNGQYNNTSSGLVSLSSGSYKVDWVYLATDSDVNVLYSQNQYSSFLSASQAQVPSMIAPELLTDSFLVGRIIIQSGSFQFADVDSVFASTFTTAPSTPEHNSLSGLQGGAAGQYYHLTAAEYTGTGTGVFVRQTDGNLTASLQGTSSWSQTSSVSLSNISASHALMADTSSLATSASWAPPIPSVSASWADMAGTASFAITASFAMNGGGGPTGNTVLFASSSLEADIALLAWDSISSSFANTSSWAINAVNGGTQIITASFLPVTSSWAQTASIAISASQANTSLSSSYPWTITGSGITFKTGNVGVGADAPSYNFHVQPTGSFAATGGTITTVGLYTIHTFTVSGSSTFTVLSGQSSVDYLIIGGGGGGGTTDAGNAGGGGAGGYRCSVFGESSGRNTISESSPTLVAGVYTVMVGAGGGSNTNGQTSSFNNIVALGGGHGGEYQFAGVNGGSGGGGGQSSGASNAGGTGSSFQGFDGGTTAGSAIGASGGGGAGQNGNSSYGTSNREGGYGGNGITSSISGTPTVRAGGGAGSSHGTATNGVPKGGVGGGGNGHYGALAATNGSPNTGGGGGGGGETVATGTGGSGVVILRYLTPNRTDVIVNASGNVGIGTTSPVNKLDVAGNIACSVITASLFFGTASISTTSSFATTSSWANNSPATTLFTASFYQITSSWAASSSLNLPIKNYTVYQFSGFFGNSGASIPSAVYHMSIGQASGSIVLMGGRTATGASNISNVIWTSSKSDPLKVTASPHTLPYGVYEAGDIQLIGDKLYLFGGLVNSGGVIAATASIITASANDPTTWRIAGQLPFGLGNHNIIKIGDKLWTFGGVTGSLTASISDPLTWSPTLTNTNLYSLGGRVLNIGNTLYLYGGQPGNGTFGMNANVYTASASNPTLWGTGSTGAAIHNTAYVFMVGDSVFVGGNQLGDNNFGDNTITRYSGSSFANSAGTLTWPFKIGENTNPIVVPDGSGSQKVYWYAMQSDGGSFSFSTITTIYTSSINTSIFSLSPVPISYDITSSLNPQIAPWKAGYQPFLNSDIIPTTSSWAVNALAAISASTIVNPSITTGSGAPVTLQGYFQILISTSSMWVPYYSSP